MKNMLKVALVATLLVGYTTDVMAKSSFSSGSRSSFSSYKSSSSSSYKSSSSSYKSPSSYGSSSSSYKSPSSSYAPSANKSYNSTNSYSGTSSYKLSSPSTTIVKPKPVETGTVKKAMDSNPTLKSYGSIVTKSEVPVKSTKDPMVPSSKPTTTYIPSQPKTVPNVNQSMGYTPQNVVQPKTFGISPTVKNVAVGAAVGAGAVMVADHVMADSHHDTVVSAPVQQSSGNQHYQSSNNGYNSNNQSYNNQNYNNNRNYNNSRPRQNTGAPYTYYGLGTAYNHRQLDSSKFFRNYWMYRAMMGSSYHKPLYVYHTANSNYYSNLTDAEWVDVQKNTETYLTGMKSVKEYLDRGFAGCAGKPYSCFDSGDKKENAKFAYNTAFYEGFMKTQEGKTVKSDIPDLKARVFDSFSYDMHRHQELIFKIKVPVEGDKDVVQAAKEGYFSGYAVGLYVNKNNMQ